MRTMLAHNYLVMWPYALSLLYLVIVTTHQVVITQYDFQKLRCENVVRFQHV